MLFLTKRNHISDRVDLKEKAVPIPCIIYQIAWKKPICSRCSNTSIASHAAHHVIAELTAHRGSSVMADLHHLPSSKPAPSNPFISALAVIYYI
jgi:hypothetical protein